MSETPEFDAPDYCGYTEYVDGPEPEDLPNTGAGASGLEREVWNAVADVEDPEMPVSVVELGLIYGVDVEETETGSNAVVEMTLTYSGCPAREMLTNDVRCAALAAGVEEAEVRLRYSPNWNVNMVTEQGREDLREFGLSV